MELGLDGRVALVTGATRGLGAAIALALSREGVRVLATGRDPHRLEELAARCPSPVVTVACDLHDAATAQTLPAQAVDAFGSLDIVVNNAGIVPRGAFLDTTPHDLSEMFAVNVFAPFAIIRAAGRILIPQGRGCVVNIASTAGLIGAPGLVAYSATKAAMVRMTESLAVEWADTGVRVNAIAPGAFATEAQPYDLSDEASRSRRSARIPAGRLGDPAEVAALVAYLCSDHSEFILGSTFVIDGGETARS